MAARGGSTSLFADDSDLDVENASINRPLLSSSSSRDDSSQPSTCIYGGNEKTNFLSLPKDKFHVALAIFYLLGMGSLLPWNFFTTGKQYYTYKLRNTSLPLNETDDSDKLTYLQVTFESYLSVFANVPNILFMFINMSITKLVRTSIRLMSGMILMILVFTVTVVFSFLNTDSYQVEFFWFTMISVVIINSGAALMQGSLFGLSSLFPYKYTKAVMQGQSVGGVVAALAYIASLLLGTSAMTSGEAYFIGATCVLIICLLCYIILCRLPFTTQTIRRSSMKRDTSVQNFSTFSRSSISDSAQEPTFAERRSSTSGLFPALLGPASTVFIVFAVTLSVYPALLSSIKSLSNPESLYFTPLSCFLAFNFSDLIGRSIPALCKRPRSSILLVLFALLRIIFIPLFLLCNYLPRRYSGIPVYFTSDFVPPMLVMLFGASNGYLSTIAMMVGPSLVPPELAELAGALLSFFLVLGLGVGSGLSFVFTTIL